MKIFVFLFCLFLFLSGHTWAQSIYSNDELIERSVERLQKELRLSPEQTRQILFLRKEEFRVMDSIWTVQKTTGRRFNARKFIAKYDAMMKSLLTGKQLRKLDAINGRRQNNTHPLVAPRQGK